MQIQSILFSILLLVATLITPTGLSYAQTNQTGSMNGTSTITNQTSSMNGTSTITNQTSSINPIITLTNQTVIVSSNQTKVETENLGQEISTFVQNSMSIFKIQRKKRRNENSNSRFKSQNERNER